MGVSVRRESAEHSGERRVVRPAALSSMCARGEFGGIRAEIHMCVVVVLGGVAGVRSHAALRVLTAVSFSRRGGAFCIDDREACVCIQYSGAGCRGRGPPQGGPRSVTDTKT